MTKLDKAYVMTQTIYGCHHNVKVLAGDIISEIEIDEINPQFIKSMKITREHHLIGCSSSEYKTVDNGRYPLSLEILYKFGEEIELPSNDNSDKLSQKEMERHFKVLNSETDEFISSDWQTKEESEKNCF